MCRKIFMFMIVLALGLLVGCEKNISEVTEQVSAAEITAASVSESETSESTFAETTSVTSETVIFCDESVFEETSAEIEANTKGIKVTPADEVYNIYPKRITYPEKTETNITAEKAEINEEFKKDGYTVFEFIAEYPVFSGGDEAVMREINDGVKAYIDEVYEDISKRTEEYDLDDDDALLYGHFTMRICALGLWESGIDLDYDINGNILSVDFYTEDHPPMAAHGAVRPVFLVFDLRTGERVDFNNIFEDKNAVVNEINMAAYQYFENRWSRRSIDEYESGFEEFAESPDYYDFNDGQITVKNGCLSYCSIPYEFGGSFADGMELMEVAVEDIFPYLNETGKSLFEGYASAKSEPVNIIEKNGEKHFDMDKNSEQ